METDRGFVSILWTLNSGVDILVAIGVLVLGFVVVRPVHQTAGMIIGGAGAARTAALILLAILRALQDPSDGFGSSMAIGILSSLLSLGAGVVFWGGVIAGVWQMAEYRMKLGGIR